MLRGSGLARTLASLLLLAALLAACGDDGGAPPPVPAPATAPPPDPVPQVESTRAVALARAAVEALAEDPQRGLIFATEAAQEGWTPEVREALHRALDAVRGEVPFAEHRGSSLSAVWSPDGTRVLTTSLDMTARLWTPDGAAKALLAGHMGSIHRACFSPDGTRIATASVDHTARVWDLEGTLLDTHRGQHAEIADVGWSADGTRLLSVCLDGSAWLRDEEGTWHDLTPEDRVVLSAWHVDSLLSDLYLLTENHGGMFAKLDPDVKLSGQDDTDIVAVAARGDGRYFALLTDGPLVYLYDAQENTHAYLENHGAQSLAASFSADGTLLVTASLDATARIHVIDGPDGAMLSGHGAAIHAATFSPDGKTVLTVSSDRTARLWSLEGKQIGILGGAEDPIATAAFSPSGDRILTTTYHRGPAKVWARDGRLLQVLPDDTGRTLAATWSPDGMRVLTLDRTLTPHVRIVDDAALVAAAATAIDRESTAAERRRLDGIRAAPLPDAALTSARFAAARPEPTSEDAVLRGDYAGTVVCASCHREAYEGWFTSSHARTSYFATPEVLPEDVREERTVEHAPLKTSFRKVEDGWIARTTGNDGADHDFPLSMVSGHLRIRFFMTRMPDGRLQVLPAMYELPEDEWFDYSHLIFGAEGNLADPPHIPPGDPTFWTGPVRSWDVQCAHCHMSGKSPVAREEGEIGHRSLVRAYAVDCEACHGPARLHAEAWARLEMDETLTRIERLTREERVTACTQCHQEGGVLSPPFKPGQDLYEYIDPTLVVDPERADPTGRPTELIYDGTPFATSTCAHRGGLVCSDCHAPHGSKVRSLLRKAPESGWFCAKCHEDLVNDPVAHSHHRLDGSGSSCALCHMPFLTIERGHGAVADHTIGIPRLGLVSDRVQPDACTWCHTGGLGAPDDAPMLGEDELLAAYEVWWPNAKGWPQPWMEALARARMGADGAGPALVSVIADRSLPREVRGSAALLLGRKPERNEEAIFDATHDEDSLVRRNAIRSLADISGARADQRLLEALSDPSWAVCVAAARTALDGWTRVQANRHLLKAVVPVLRADAEKVPDDDLRWFRLGAAYDLLADHENALHAYERKLALDPGAKAIRRHVKNLRALLGHDAK